MDCGRIFVTNVPHHHYSEELGDRALRMYANGMEYKGYFQDFEGTVMM